LKDVRWGKVSLQFKFKKKKKEKERKEKGGKKPT
jgi:hypothetical protein